VCLWLEGSQLTTFDDSRASATSGRLVTLVQLRLRRNTYTPKRAPLYCPFLRVVDNVLARSRAPRAVCTCAVGCGVVRDVLTQRLQGPEDASRSSMLQAGQVTVAYGSPRSNGAVAWTTALMAVGPLEGDGRDDGWEYADDGASSWSVASLETLESGAPNTC
jgi:hypothetical protein